MFSGFWGWFLVVVIVAVIFGAGKLPELRALAEEKLKFAVDEAKKKKIEVENKINEVKEQQKTAREEAAARKAEETKKEEIEEITEEDLKF